MRFGAPACRVFPIAEITNLAGVEVFGQGYGLSFAPRGYKNDYVTYFPSFTRGKVAPTRAK